MWRQHQPSTETSFAHTTLTDEEVNGEHVEGASIEEREKSLSKRVLDHPLKKNPSNTVLLS